MEQAWQKVVPVRFALSGRGAIHPSVAMEIQVDDLQGGQSANQSGSSQDCGDTGSVGLSPRAMGGCSEWASDATRRGTAGRVANDVQLKIMKSCILELVMHFIASSHPLFRQAGGWRSGMRFIPRSSLRMMLVPAVPVRNLRTFFRGWTANCGEGVHCGHRHAIR
jgi:hypothetical protein